MRLLDYIIAAIVEGIFFMGIACLIGAAIAQVINRKPRVPTNYRRPRFWWLEELRAKHHMQNLDRLARKIERELERKQRRAEAWQRNHLM